MSEAVTSSIVDRNVIGSGTADNTDSASGKDSDETMLVVVGAVIGRSTALSINRVVSACDTGLLP